jgi:biotin carboxyl carrier protein
MAKDDDEPPMARTVGDAEGWEEAVQGFSGQLAMAAGAGAGGHATSLWARHAREDLQSAHTLTTPLARWAPEVAEAPAMLTCAAADDAQIAIPESVISPRPPLRLPEDAVCRSPIAGLVVAVLAKVGDRVAGHQPVMVIEAMKMQNNVCPEVDGVLRAVHVSAGHAVKTGQVLFELL